MHHEFNLNISIFLTLWQFSQSVIWTSSQRQFDPLPLENHCIAVFSGLVLVDLHLKTMKFPYAFFFLLWYHQYHIIYQLLQTQHFSQHESCSKQCYHLSIPIDVGYSKVSCIAERFLEIVSRDPTIKGDNFMCLPYLFDLSWYLSIFTCFTLSVLIPSCHNIYQDLFITDIRAIAFQTLVSEGGDISYELHLLINNYWRS